VLIPEFAPQSGVMLTWPHPDSDWKNLLADVEPVYIAIARAICAREPLLVICLDDAHRAAVARQLDAAGIAPSARQLVLQPTNDTWVRDYGPLSVQRDGQTVLQDYAFNAWGGKYGSSLDDAVTGALCRAGVFGRTPCERHERVLEGGSIDVDGAGTLLTTARCLLAETRNPALGKAGVEAWFREQFGIEHVLWLEHGELAGDDTDSHVDMLARFCDTGTIAYTSCTDLRDPHFAALDAMECELRRLRTRDGTPYRLVPLPIPAPIHDAAGQRLPASYANFLTINGAVLLPVYADHADPVAAQALAGCFPGRAIVPIDCRALIGQFGSLHCATMQLAAGVLPGDERIT